MIHQIKNSQVADLNKGKPPPYTYNTIFLSIRNTAAHTDQHNHTSQTAVHMPCKLILQQMK